MGKRKILTNIAVVFLGGFTFFCFGTLELYLTNQSEFWFSYGDLLPAIAIGFIIFVLAGIIILGVIPERVYKYSIAFVFACAIATYIQGNFLPNDYGSLDGTAIDWGIYQGRFIYNSIIWGALILGLLVLTKKIPDRMFKFFRVMSVIIVITQIVTLVTLGLTMRSTVDVGRRILSGNDDAVFSGAGSCERRGLIGTTDFPQRKRRGVVAPSIARNPVSR